MNWFTRLKRLVYRWLDLEYDAAFDELKSAGFRKCRLMGEDGRHRVSLDLVGWWVEEEKRCWRFGARVYDPDTWPTGLEDAFFLSITRPERLIGQVVIVDNGDCWWADDTLILQRRTPGYILTKLVEYPEPWRIVAERLGLAVVEHERWSHRT